MKIIVCLKLIADPDIVEFDVVTERLTNIYTVLDPIGRHVLEEGLAWREKRGGEVIAVSVCPGAGEGMLRDALLQGADRAVRLWSDGLLSADTWLVSQAIETGLRRTGFDLVLCGARSRDSGSGLLAIALAARLKVASATGIVSLEIEGDGKVLAHKKIPRGQRETYRLALPAVIGVEEGINTPRYVAPFSRTYRRGMEKPVEFFEVNPAGRPLVARLRLVPSRPRVKAGVNLAALSTQDRLKMMRGELGRKRETFEGPSPEAARKILDRLSEYL
jgi:electron transfer flavoprotein beta subunit